MVCLIFQSIASNSVTAIGCAQVARHSGLFLFEEKGWDEVKRERLLVAFYSDKAPFQSTLMNASNFLRSVSSVTFYFLAFFKTADASQVFVGAYSVDITPKLPAALDGQMNLRVATVVETPLTANVIVLESRQKDKTLNTSVFVSCDLVTIPDELRNLIRQSVAKRIPGFETDKIIINATHTDTAAVVRDGWYTIPPEVTQVKSYHRFAAEKIVEAIVSAWNQRKPGSVSWGMGHAKVA